MRKNENKLTLSKRALFIDIIWMVFMRLESLALHHFFISFGI